MGCQPHARWPRAAIPEDQFQASPRNLEPETWNLKPAELREYGANSRPVLSPVPPNTPDSPAQRWRAPRSCLLARRRSPGHDDQCRRCPARWDATYGLWRWPFSPNLWLSEWQSPAWPGAPRNPARGCWPYGRGAGSGPPGATCSGTTARECAACKRRR